MTKQEWNTVWSQFAMGLVLIVVTGLVGSQIRNLKSENEVLKAEIVKWQEAAQPAIDARGWTLRVLRPSGLKPVELKYALNPCIPSPEGLWNCSFEEGKRSIPIKIVRDDGR